MVIVYQEDPSREPLPDCDKCNNTRWIERDGETVRCSCVIERKMRKYLHGGLGEVDKPNDWMFNAIEDLDTYEQNIFLKFGRPEEEFSHKKVRGLFGYMLLEDIFPRSYRTLTFEQYWKDIINGDKSVYDFNEDLIIMMIGIGEEFRYRGPDSWKAELPDQGIKQVISNRLRTGRLVWVAEFEDYDREKAKKYISNNGFKIADLEKAYEERHGTDVGVDIPI